MKWKTNGTQPVCNPTDSQFKVNLSPVFSPKVNTDAFGISLSPSSSQKTTIANQSL